MEPLVAAASRVADICSLGHDKELALKAAEDLDEAKALCKYMMVWDECFWPYGEGTLCTFLGILYLSRRLLSDEQEKKACLQTLDWPHAELHLHCLLGFGSLLESSNFSGYSTDLDVCGPLEEMWEQYCSERQIQVSSERGERPPVDTDEWPVKPYRSPPNKLYLPCKKTSTKPREVPVPSGGEVPKLFDLADKIMKSNYFVFVPADKQGWNVRDCIARRHKRGVPCYTLLNTVDDAYSCLTKTRACFIPEPLPEYDIEPLRISEARLLLKGIGCNTLLRSLVVDKPPNSTLSHLFSVINCMQHARLWLARLDLRIYYDHSLTYAQMCTREAANAEEEVLLNGFMLERGPSIVENRLRQASLGVLWGGDGCVLNMRPEDYELAKAPTGSVLWDALKQLGHARVANAGYYMQLAPPLVDIAQAYVPLLGFETAAKRRHLYTGGSPDAEEVAKYQQSFEMLSYYDPFTPVCTF